MGSPPVLPWRAPLGARGRGLGASVVLAALLVGACVDAGVGGGPPNEIERSRIPSVLNAIGDGPAATEAAPRGEAAPDGVETAAVDPSAGVGLDVLPTTDSMAETSAASQKGRPLGDEDLTVIQKRHLYAQRVMSECVKAAPDFVSGLQASALQPTPPLSSGARAFADRSFRVAASSDGRFCDVRALGGSLDVFARSMRTAFAGRGELVDWSRDGERWAGALVIDERRYRVVARQERLDAGFINIATMSRR